MFIIGCDEAGRGSLAGPIVGAAVSFYLPESWSNLKDSKQLTPAQREKIFKTICDEAYVSYEIVGASTIDFVGIQVANARVLINPALHIHREMIKDREISLLGHGKIQIIADGNMKLGYDSISEPKADEKYPAVAAASIVAKVIRDNIMIGYDHLWPQFNFAEHKGYYCKEHVNAIRHYGRCLIHRESYKLKDLGEK